MTARLSILHRGAVPGAARFPEMNAQEQAEFRAAVELARAVKVAFKERARIPVLVASNLEPEPCAIPAAQLRAVPEAEPEAEAEP